jgi:predicted nucleic acid-binding protein
VRTALDTNIISTILSGYPSSGQIARTLAQAANEGALVICAPIYVELLAYPNMTAEYLERFLAHTRVEVDFLIDAPVWRDAGQCFARYADRRRKSSGGEAKRLLVDFIVGAHASLRADRLFTLDPRRYNKDFPKLQLV